jgi:hypothetical protein
MSLTVWTNHAFRPEALDQFRRGLAAAGHRPIRLWRGRTLPSDNRMSTTPCA